MRNHDYLLPGILVLVMACSTAMAQPTFDSRSGGSDGALDFTGQSGVIDFEPFTFNPPLDPDGDQVFHFTTITIPADVTIRMRADKLPNGPVYWLATGDVIIEGTLDLRGEQGSPQGPRGAALPGPGGFPGGVGQGTNSAATRGGGPGGGDASTNSGVASASHATGGREYGNVFLTPLIGGSGGGGYNGGSSIVGGGAGGGAILIASNTVIRVAGTVSVRAGGSGFNGGQISGHGSGGAIRLLAPSIEGSGSLLASSSSVAGRIRMESFSNTHSGNIEGSFRIVRLVESVRFLPEDRPPLVRVTSIGGVAVPNNPTGNIFSPDVTIDSAVPVVVAVAAEKIPLGTELTLQIWSDTAGLQTVQTTPLAGTLEASTASAMVTFAPEASRIFVRAQWTP
ncbi:MAG: hypothetical protein MI923_21365 [Phycisphaerales bacterium]|nr:hypothetical protein [Phycisphaerales bacterium]